MRKRIREKKYKINYYSAGKLLENGYLEDGFLVCDKEATYYSMIDSYSHENCQLFDQAIKALGEGVDLSEIFVILDFSDVDKVSRFLPFSNGIKLFFNNKEIIFQDYLKSNSMNKNSRIYYINSEYYSIIHERISFGFDKVSKVPMSKWYAYSGLSLSDATVLNNIDISRDELCVIPDKKIYKNISCVTAISIPILVDILYEYQERIEKHVNNPRYIHERDYLFDEMHNEDEVLLKDCYQINLEDLDKEIACYYNSPDFDYLSSEIQNLLIDIIDLKECNMDDILDRIDDLIFDYEQLLNPNEIEWSKISVENFRVEINCFDGEGLISKDFAEELNYSLCGRDIQQDEDEEERESKIENINSFQIRLPFLKGVIHSTDIMAFCKKHKITEIEGIYDFKNKKMKKYDVSKIKIVVTESQFKAASFMKYLSNFTMDDYFDLLEKYDYHIAISGVEPKEKKRVKLCYQFLSTLPLAPQDIDYLIESNKLELYESIEQDNVVEGLRMASNKTYNTGVELYDINQLFYVSTNLYLNRRRDCFEFEKNNLALGKLSVAGTRKYLVSDLLALLYHMIGKYSQRPLKLTTNQFYCPNTELNERCIILRNPHYSRNEIVILNNSLGVLKERQEFFGHLTGVLMVNPESMIADRLGGADYDGDEVCIVNDYEIFDNIYPKLMSKSKTNPFKYPLVKIPSITNHQAYKKESLYEQRIRSLESTFSNRTGKISNFAFEKTLDVYWKASPTIKEMEDVSFFTVLGGLEIDSCKNGKKPALPKRKGDVIEYLKIKDIFLKRRRTDNEAIELPKYNKKVNEQKDKNTLYYVFYNFIKEKLPPISKGFEVIKPPCSYDEKFYKCVAITECYSHIIRTIRDDNTINKNKVKELLGAIEHELSKIFKSNEYEIDIEQLIKKFKFNSVLNFEKYLNDKSAPYHFLTTNEEKENYILNVLGINDLTSEELNALYNFNNLGYKSVYLALYYNYLSDYRSRLKVLLNDYDYESLHFVSKKIIENVLDMDMVFELIEKYLFDICKSVDKSSDKEILIMKINKYFYNLACDIDYSTILNVINPLESEMTFNIYYDHIKKYLLDLEDEQNV